MQRLGPPHWPTYPPGAAYGALYDRDRDTGLAAARLGARLIAADLAALGIDVDCLPLADVPVAGADPVSAIAPMARSRPKSRRSPALSPRAWSEGGVLPVLKHIPGHGRATADSHTRLPVVNTDRPPRSDRFCRIPAARRDLPIAMTAHVVFTAIDPIAPATISATIVRDVIRDSIGFRGLLMSDDISMGALSGSVGERTRAAIAAGCDMVLHCNGEMPEMLAVAAEAPRLAGEAAQRADAALAATKQAVPIDLAAGRARVPPTDGRHLAAGAGIRMIAEDMQFETELPERATRRAGAGGRRRGI